MNRKSEKGVALILALILLLIISVMAVSLMFMSQTETWSSLNYKLMSQARDGSEAGINAGANYLMGLGTNVYTPPATTGTDTLSGYNYNVSPVQYPASASSGEDVLLATTKSKKVNNYPVSSVVTNWQNAAEGNFTAGNATVTYATSAKLLSMAQVTPWGTTTPVTIQTWEITSDGTINGIRAADEQLSAVLEKQVTPVFTYAAFADANGCTAIQFGGGGKTGSYDSSNLTLSGGVPVTSTSNGNIGTNGNLGTTGSPTTINGTLSTPRTGTGTCTSGNVSAWTSSGGTVTGGIVQLPQPVVYPPPAAPNPAPPTTSITLNNSAADCGGVTGCTYGTGPLPAGNGCPSGDFCLAPGSCPPLATGPGLYGNVTVKGTVHLSNNAGNGCYNINSLTENGGGTIAVDSGPAVVNIAGSGTTTPVTLTGGGLISNAGWNAQVFQILYAGTGTVTVKGGANAVGLLYAPNATFSFNSAGGNWYGAVIVGSMTDMGGATVNYDLSLRKEAVTVGNWMLDSFTWKRR